MINDGGFKRLKSLDAWHRLGRWSRVVAWLLRLLSSAAYRLLEVVLGRRHPHGRVIGQLGELTQTGAVADEGPRVLLFTVRGWFAHVGIEALLGMALRERGCRVTAMICGGVREQCDFKPATDIRPTRPLCWRCQSFAERAYAAAQIPVTKASDGWVEADPGLTSLRGEDLVRHVHRGLPVGQLVLPSVQRSLLRGDVRMDNVEDVRVLRGFVQAACGWVDRAELAIDELAPDVIVLTNGSFHAERVMLEVAQRRGIRVISYERGMQPNSIILSDDHPVVPFVTLPVGTRAPELRPEQSRQLDTYLAKRERVPVGGGALAGERAGPASGCEQHLGVSPGVPVAVLFTNILWDSAVFGRDEAFAGMTDWVLTTIEAFRTRPDRHLVIRVHPAEVRLPMAASRDRIIDRILAEHPVLPANVSVVGPEQEISSYDLMDCADVVLTYTSTVGIEAAARGTRVLAAGLTHYRGQGFTPEFDDRGRYAALLDDAFAAGGLTEEERDMARRYAFHFFFRFARPFPWLEDRSRAQRSVTVDPGDLKVGGDPWLDNLCDWVLGTATLDPELARFADV